MVVFMGERMVCVICGFKQQSHPEIESGWWCMIAGDRKIYVCPKCFGSFYSFCNTCKKFFDIHYRKCPLCGGKLEKNLKVDEEKMKNALMKLSEV